MQQRGVGEVEWGVHARGAVWGTGRGEVRDEGRRVLHCSTKHGQSAATLPTSVELLCGSASVR